MDRLIDSITNYIYINNEKINDEKKEIIRYGLEIFMLKTLFFLSVTLIGFLMGSLKECLLFTLLFSGIRKTAGGYHSETRIKCYFMSMSLFIFVLAVQNIHDAYNILMFPLMIMTVLSSFIIWKYAPVDTPNKPLDEVERTMFSKKAKGRLIAEIIIGISAYYLGFHFVTCSVMLSLTSVSSLMLLGKNAGRYSKEQQLQ